MQVQDRGTKKWVSLMLPEHVDMLKEVFIDYKKKPVLDMQEMERIDTILKWALDTNEEIEITYFDGGFFKKHRGRLKQIDQWKGYIILFQAGGLRISLDDIIDIEKGIQN
ncbi:MAG TPA: YolD-like family protein [Pseudogracilibacillus sp.]|nr:YolD-like family protein [Pseudogracilibacillus sp.]